MLQSEVCSLRQLSTKTSLERCVIFACHIGRFFHLVDLRVSCSRRLAARWHTMRGVYVFHLNLVYVRPSSIQVEQVWLSFYSDRDFTTRVRTCLYFTSSCLFVCILSMVWWNGAFTLLTLKLHLHSNISGWCKLVWSSYLEKKQDHITRS